MSLNVGVIGCGMVSHAYLGSIVCTPGLTLAALASPTMHSARTQAARYGGHAVTVNALLADPAIDLVVNLAPPGVHHSIGRRALEAGKHLYSEKPFATTLDDAADLLDLAGSRTLAIGCAPDTFLGAPQQLARRLIDDGAIGQITGGAIAFGTRGMESWHPDPAFFYAVGGGPLLDIGPYYLTALVNLLGPVTEVVAIGTTPRTTRQITSPSRAGETIAVDVPTSVTGGLLFESGANISLALSWDIPAHTRPPIQLYGTDGTMTVPDPNQFGGALRVSADGYRWESHDDTKPPRPVTPEILSRAMQAIGQGIDPVNGGPIGPDTALHMGDRRGLGLIDLAAGLAQGRSPRADGRLAFHVLETLLALERSARGEGRILIRSRVDRPLPEPYP